METVITIQGIEVETTLEDISTFGEGEHAFHTAYATVNGVRLFVSSMGDTNTWEAEHHAERKGFAASCEGLAEAGHFHAAVLADADRIKSQLNAVHDEIEARLDALRQELLQEHALLWALDALLVFDVGQQRQAILEAAETAYQQNPGGGKTFANGAIQLKTTSRVVFDDTDTTIEYCKAHYTDGLAINAQTFEKAMKAGVIRPAAGVAHLEESHHIAINKSKLGVE